MTSAFCRISHRTSINSGMEKWENHIENRTSLRATLPTAAFLRVRFIMFYRQPLIRKEFSDIFRSFWTFEENKSAFLGQKHQLRIWMAEAPATAIRLFFQEKGSFALSRFRFAWRNEANKLVSAISAAFLPSPSTASRPAIWISKRPQTHDSGTKTCCLHFLTDMSSWATRFWENPIMGEAIPIPREITLGIFSWIELLISHSL